MFSSFKSTSNICFLLFLFRMYLVERNEIEEMEIKPFPLFDSVSSPLYLHFHPLWGEIVFVFFLKKLTKL